MDFNRLVRCQRGLKFAASKPTRLFNHQVFVDKKISGNLSKTFKIKGDFILFGQSLC